MVRPARFRFRKKGSRSVRSLKLTRFIAKFFVVSIPYVLTMALLAGLFGGAVAYAVNSPIFRLGDVKILNVGAMTGAQAFRFCELSPGENLIRLDLVGVQQVVKAKYPEFKEVRVRRVLPNRIEVILKRRTPIAQAMFSKYYQIDRDLVLLRGVSETPFRNLVLIEGAAMPNQGLWVGAALKDPGTKKAVALADLIRRLGILRKHFLTKINVTDPQNIVFTVDHAVEIRIGGNHFEDRLKILGETLKTVELDPVRIEYVDLRFDDVVIGPRSLASVSRKK